MFEVTRGINFVAAHQDRLAQARDRLSPNVIDNTERGLQFTAAEVGRALVAQTQIQRGYTAMFDDIDILICPGAAVTPFPHAEWAVTEIDGEDMPTYMRWLAIAYALTLALPAVACIPCGVDEHGMPFGLQVAGPRGSDRRVLEIAMALEAALAADPETARPLPDLARLEG